MVFGNPTDYNTKAIQTIQCDKNIMKVIASSSKNHKYFPNLHGYIIV